MKDAGVANKTKINIAKSPYSSESKALWKEKLSDKMKNVVYNDKTLESNPESQ